MRLPFFAALSALTAALLLTGCGQTAPPPKESDTPAAEAAAPTEIRPADVTGGFVPAPPTVTGGNTAPRDLEAEAAQEEDLSTLPLDRPYDFDPDAMLPADFGDLFTEAYPCESSAYTLLPGDSYSNEVTVLRGENEGPVIYVVAGVHGDEEAAWQAGKLLKKIGIKAGTLYILAPANRWGAEKVPKSRYVDSKDLNRAFPGSADGTNAQRVANAIYRDVAEKQPDFVLDLHEASIVQEGRDYLGSSLIFTDVTLFEDLYFDLLWATEDGEVCSRPFYNYSPAPAGSINNTVSTNLRIPVLTVETFRGYTMENRIADQLAVVQYVLRYYGMY